MPMSFRVCVALLVCCSPPVASAGEISPVYPGTIGTGIECEFETIQAALDAAAVAPGAQTMRVTRSRAYSDQALVVNDTGSVTLEGGYATCFSAHDGQRTAIDGAAAPVVRITGPGNLTLRDLDISGGNSPDGGGVAHGGTGTVTIERSVLHGNRSSGGGSAVGTSGTGALWILDSEIRENPGVHALYADSSGTTLIEDSSFLQNAGSVTIGRGTATLLRVVLRNTGTNLLLGGDSITQVSEATIEDGSLGVSFTGSGSLEISDSRIAGNGNNCSGSGGVAVTAASTGIVNLRDVEIVDNCASAAGGGLSHRGSGLVSLERTRFSGNRAPVGGGIALIGTDASTPRLNGGQGLVVEDSGDGVQEGGGIYVEHAELDLTQAPGHAIRNNRAVVGGGVFLRNGLARIGSGAPGGSIRDNVAANDGGGVYLAGDSTLQLYTTVPAAPAGIAGNRAGGTYYGGGIAMAPETTGQRVFLYDAQLTDNEAGTGGGGVSIFAGLTPGTVFCMGRAAEPDSCTDLGGSVPADARACADPQACNLVRGNVSNGFVGGAALVRVANGTEPIRVRLVGARLLDNSGRSLFTSLPNVFPLPIPVGAFEIRDSVLAANVATNALFDSAPGGTGAFPPEYSYAFGALTIERSTIAGNNVGAAYLIGSRIDLRLHESIVQQPFVSVHAGNAGGIDAQGVIVANAQGLPVRADIVVADPLLADADNGDVRLLPGSPAIDFSNLGSGGLDVDGLPRGHDMAGVANRFGSRDLGAHEAGALAPLFVDGFEGGVPE